MTAVPLRHDVTQVPQGGLLGSEAARTMLFDWFEDRGGSRLPASLPWRGDQNSALPSNVAILQVEPGQTFRYIAAGDSVAPLLGGSPIGHWLDAFPSGRGGEGLCIAVVAAMHMALPQLVRVQARVRGALKPLEALFMPYGADVQAPSHIAVCFGLAGAGRGRLEDAAECVLLALGEQVVSRLRHRGEVARTRPPEAAAASPSLIASTPATASSPSPAVASTTTSATATATAPPPKNDYSDRRTDGRINLRERAQIRIGGIESPCVIEDISASGAALALMNATTLKGREGTLISERFGHLRFAVRWRSLNRMGIEFTASMTQARKLRDGLRALEGKR